MKTDLAADQEGVEEDQHAPHRKRTGPLPRAALDGPEALGVRRHGRGQGEAGGEEPQVQQVLHRHHGQRAREPPTAGVVGQDGGEEQALAEPAEGGAEERAAPGGGGARERLGGCYRWWLHRGGCAV